MKTRSFNYSSEANTSASSLDELYRVSVVLLKYSKFPMFVIVILMACCRKDAS